jgi:membrane-associated phospholipid phosphatase
LLVKESAHVPGWEGSIASTVNGWSDWMARPIWPVMQLGNVWMVAVLPAGVLVWQRRWQAVAAATVAPLAAWGLAKVVKSMVGRGRPADYVDSIRVREAAVHGNGFVSGHAAVAFASAVVVAVYLPARWRVVPFALATCTGMARLYFGVHLPLDVVGGAGLGVACGALTMWAFGEDGTMRAPEHGQTRPA